MGADDQHHQYALLMARVDLSLRRDDVAPST